MHGLMQPAGLWFPQTPGSEFKLCPCAIPRASDCASGPEEGRRTGKWWKPGYATFCFMLLVSQALAGRTPPNLCPAVTQLLQLRLLPWTRRAAGSRQRGEACQQTEWHRPEAASPSLWSNNASWFLSILCILCDVNGLFPASCLWMLECLVMMISGLDNSVHVCYSAERFTRPSVKSLTLEQIYYPWIKLEIIPGK